ncbi:hypothetical protein QAD02_002719 [Eretmocerus hayati]|uniref:Uncharacterized protein n=1 Tax=Eretmocerus hayati TaxID=131215 RepID=A0ACC2NPK5_9HYME|nr:hypothetical protein QAD02_002719 [Eretmocerus hayati]
MDSLLLYTDDPSREYMPKTGCFLGDLTNELEAYGPDSYTKKFASGGPKFHAYIVCKSDEEEEEAPQRFLSFNDDNHESSNGQTECAESTDDDALDSGGDGVTLVKYSDENIINSVPNTYRWKCEQLLKCLHGCGQEHISWDDSGTVRINGTAIPDPNIVDLVNLAVRWRKSYSAVGEQEFANFLQKSTIPREFIDNTSLLNDEYDTPLANLERKYGRISRHSSDSAVIPSNLADPRESGDGKEADNVEDCSEVFNETADSTLGYSTPGTKKKKPSWVTLTLNK